MRAQAVRWLGTKSRCIMGGFAFFHLLLFYFTPEIIKCGADAKGYCVCCLESLCEPGGGSAHL